MTKWLTRLLLALPRTASPRGQNLRVEQRIWLGQNQSLVLVSVFGRSLLIGASQNSIQVLDRGDPLETETRC